MREVNEEFKEVVVKIPKKIYERFGREYEEDLVSDYVTEVILIALAKGTVLPEGHGRIGDLDAVMNDISTSIDEMTSMGVAVDGEYLWAKLNNAIDNAQTFIEADKKDAPKKRKGIPLEENDSGYNCENWIP